MGRDGERREEEVGSNARDFSWSDIKAEYDLSRVAGVEGERHLRPP